MFCSFAAKKSRCADCILPLLLYPHHVSEHCMMIPLRIVPRTITPIVKEALLNLFFKDV